MEDLQVVEHICREDPKVIEQCEISGIPQQDMHKVYCDREYLPINWLHADLQKLGQSDSMSDLATKFAYSKL